MKSLEVIRVVDEELEREAHDEARFRSRVKSYLSAAGKCYDKFTITQNDTFLGHVSETAVKDYLEKEYGDIIEVKRWSDEFDLERIRNTVKNNLRDSTETDYVIEYFYDSLVGLGVLIIILVIAYIRSKKR